MKKKVVAMMLSVMLAMTVTACGGKDDASNAAVDSTESVGNTDDTESDAEVYTYVSASREFDLDGNDYVKELCDYSKIPVTITGNYEVDHEDAVNYLEQSLAYYGPFYTADDTKTVISEGDIVNVDYVGTQNGEAFTGGSAENQNIDVYNNMSADKNIYGQRTTYIEGFTDALKGAKVGDVVDANVTFPEDYSNEELAGQEVVFTFTVNSIQQEVTVDNVDADFAKEQFRVDTVEEMYDFLEENLISAAASQKQQDINNAVQEYLLEHCTVEVPEDYLDARLSDYKANYISENCQGDEEMLENFLSSYYSKTVEEAEEIWRDGISRQIRTEFILDAVAEAENISFDEEGFHTYVESQMSSNNYDSEQQVYASYGYGDPVFGEAYTRKFYVQNLALDVILETAEVTEEPAAEAGSVEGTEDAESTEDLEGTEDVENTEEE